MATPAIITLVEAFKNFCHASGVDPEEFTLSVKADHIGLARYVESAAMASLKPDYHALFVAEKGRIRIDKVRTEFTWL